VVIALGVIGLVSGCTRPAPPPPAQTQTTPVYSEKTGRLEEVVHRDANGKVDTRAFMDGVLVKRIEIDRNHDGRTDRWEYYAAAAPGTTPANSPDGRSMIDHADEANGPTDAVTRHEYYDNGLIARVVDDTDSDGRPDKWEYYQAGVLARVELDLAGKGYPSRRLIYGPDGNVTRVESDDAGTGRFTPVATPASPSPATNKGQR
jgi:hypothetical protein